MTHLKVFHLAKNILGDSIPKSIGKLSKLRDLDLTGNMLKGTIPYEMGSCIELSSLKLGEFYIVSRQLCVCFGGNYCI